MSRVKRRADRIRAEVPILPLLARHGFNVDPSNDSEQQFRCHLHGDDGKPSARVYPQTNSFHCWACSKSRGPIGLIMDAEGLDLNAALTKLEEEHGLPPMPFDAEPEQGPSLADQISDVTRSTRTFTQEHSRLERMLTNQTTDRDLPMDTVLSFWDALDRVTHGVEQEGWSEDQGKEQLVKLRIRLMERIGNV